MSALAAIGAVGFSRRVSPIVAAGATFIGFAALGFAWAAVLVQLRLSERLDPALEGTISSSKRTMPDTRRASGTA